MTVVSRTRSVFDTERRSVLGFCGNSCPSDCRWSRITRRPSGSSGAARGLLRARTVENEIGGLLCLGGCVDQKLAIVAKLLQPAGDIRGLIGDDRVRDSGFSAKIGCSEFRR